VAILGTALQLLWHIFTAGENSLLSRWRKDQQNFERIPPRKLTVGGLPETEIEHIEFQNRLDEWQRQNAARWSNFRQSADALNGQKYDFKPRKASLAHRASPNVPPRKVRQRFDLLN
jgi:hypothetical protein